MRRKKEESTALYEKFLSLYLSLPDLSTRELARVLGVSHTTIRRWKNGLLPNSKQKNPSENLYFRMHAELKTKLRTMLETLTSRKGVSRRTSKSKIYKLLEMDFAMLGVKNKTQALKLISYFVEKEYGSWENLEQRTRPKKEKTKYRTTKGKIPRTPATLAIDATGFTFTCKEGKEEFLVSVFLACDVYSGYLYPEPLLVDNREKAVLFYNKAFNSRFSQEPYSFSTK
jgi:transcriptional regulator with XRE-family HTH domain